LQALEPAGPGTSVQQAAAEKLPFDDQLFDAALAEPGTRVSGNGSVGQHGGTAAPAIMCLQRHGRQTRGRDSPPPTCSAVAAREERQECADRNDVWRR
jgi:hypothetical protein